MNKTLNDILTRRSIRKYTDEMISNDELDTILQAGLYAASGSGRQAAIMVAVQDPVILEKLERLNASVVGRDPDTVKNFYGAKTVIVVLAERNSSTAIQDGSLIIGNMMLAAHALGLGSCWINRARETFETDEGKQILKDIGIEGDYIGVGNCIVGHIDGEYPVARERKENRVFKI